MKEIGEKKEFEEQVIQVDRVTRVVAGGRRLRFRAAVVVGNKKGKVGIGVGKSNDVIGAVQKAIKIAKKNIISVPIVNETIPHEVKAKYGGAQVFLKPARIGSGIVAGGAVRAVADKAGIGNILSKILGSQNKINNLKATLKALSELKVSKVSEVSKVSGVSKVKEKKATTRKIKKGKK